MDWATKIELSSMKFNEKFPLKLASFEFSFVWSQTGTKLIQSAEKKIDGVKWVVQIETLNSFAAN